MATNVLIIPEDFTYDQYVLKPVVQKMFVALGVKARVQVCRDPQLGGDGEAFKKERIGEIIDRYKGMTQLFLLIVDRDCRENRRAKLNTLEEFAAEQLEGSKATFLGQEAHQEIEVWVLAGLNDLPKKWRWKDIRAECHPKEAYFDAVAKERGLENAPAQGRVALTSVAAPNYKRIRQLCPEDVGVLETRIRTALSIP